MADGNIFQQYLAPPKSVLDYSAQLDQADARRQALQQNALELAAGQQKFDEQQQAVQRATRLRTALAGLPQGATDDQRMQAMRATGTPEGYAAADALGKSILDQRKSAAAAGMAETNAAAADYTLRVKKSDQAIKDIAGFSSPQEALASLQAHVAAGDIDPARAQLIQQGIPQDPTKFSDWKVGMIRNIMSAKEQLQYLAPDANTVATNARVASEGAANRANQRTVQQMITDRQANDGDGSGLSDASKRFIAQQAVDAGDYSGLKNVGRGKQGAADLRGIRNAITDYAASKGLSPTDVSAKLAEFESMKGAMKVSANISAKVENAAAEAAQLAPLAIAAGRDVARSNFLPFGRAQVMFNNQTNDPAINKFATANIGLATAYAAAMARGNKPTVTDMEHSRELLTAAKSQDAYEAIVNQMLQEIRAAQAAPRQVRNNLSNEISGKSVAHGTAPAASTSGAKPSLSDIFGQ